MTDHLAFALYADTLPGDIQLDYSSERRIETVIDSPTHEPRSAIEMNPLALYSIQRCVQEDAIHIIHVSSVPTRLSNDCFHYYYAKSGVAKSRVLLVAV